MSYRYERPSPQRRSGTRSFLIALTVLVWVLVMACVGLRYLVRPAFTDYVNRQVAVALDPEVSPELQATEALRESLATVPLPIEVPAGQFTITEADANTYLEGYSGQLGEIDDVQVRFVPGQLRADVTVRGITGTARAEPVVSDGRIVAGNARLDQPLGSFLAIDPLFEALLGRINEEVSAQGRRITDVTIEQGQALVTVE